MTRIAADARRIDDGLSSAPVFEQEPDGTLRLLGSMCISCGARAFPRRVVCIRCGSAQKPLRLSGEGHLHSWTRLVTPPFGFDDELYYGCVDLVEGPRILCVLGDGEPRIGDRVRAMPAATRHGALGFRFEVVNA